MPRVNAFVFLLSLLIVSIVCAPGSASAQSLEDALRLSTDPLPTGSRGLGMDGALLTSATGYSALEYNPAAIAPLATRDLGLSFLYNSHNSSAAFFGTSADESLTGFNLSTIGAAAPFPTTRGHLSVGISYDRVREYNSTYSFKAINPNSSFLNTQGFIDDPHNGLIGNALRDYLDANNLAWQLHLTRDVADSTISSLRTIPFAGGLQQSGTVASSGGLNAFRVGAGIDVAPNISIGATVNLLFGTYDYTRTYNEQDVNGIYKSSQNLLPPLSFQSAQIVDNLHQDQTGGSLKLGFLAYGSDVVRFGLTLETPSVIRVNETFARTGTATFGTVNDSAKGFPGSYTVDGTTSSPIANNYTIITPMKAALGVSGHLLGATLEGDLSYTDMTQLRFTGADADVSDLNLSAQHDLRSVLSWRLGAEYVVPIIGLSLRAGYGVEPSPYKGDPSSFDTKTLSAGAGILLSQSILLEAAYRHSTYHTSHSIYNDLTVEGAPVSSNINDDLVKHDDVSLSFNYRF